MKKLSNSALIGKAGISLVGLRLADMGFLFHETGSVEAGTDGFVELRDSAAQQMLSAVLRLQSKATRDGRAWQRETNTSFAYPCKERDVADWVASNVPVILVCSDVSRQLAYWKDVTSYFKIPENRESRRVLFDKVVDVFDRAAAPKLAAIAVPKNAGVYLPPRPKTEELVSNLLPVTSHPSHLWVAPALMTDMWEVEDVLREASLGVECFIRGGHLYSFRSVDEPVWNEICDVAAAECFQASEWGGSDDTVKQHEFAELLRRALGEGVREQVEYDRKERLFYFRAPDDLSDVRLVGGRRVFGAYRTRDDTLKYYRHLGFRAHFLRLDGRWYLELNPQYRFTRDGHRVSRFQADNISGIKRLEHNDSVRQQVQALATFLAQPPTLLTPEYQFLSFGELLRFEVEFGFDETAWRVRDKEARSNLQLFDVA